MIARLKYLLPLLLLAAALWYWLTPHYSKEDEAYYVSVFCAIHHDDSRRFVADMRTVIEGGLTDDAVHDAVRIAATIHAAATALDAADVIVEVNNVESIEAAESAASA